MIGVILIAAIAIGWYLYTKKFPDKEKADYTVNAMDFIREFEQDGTKRRNDIPKRSLK